MSMKISYSKLGENWTPYIIVYRLSVASLLWWSNCVLVFQSFDVHDVIEKKELQQVVFDTSGTHLIAFNANFKIILI